MNKPFAVRVLIAALAIPAPAYAYLDPGTGSMLLQLLLGGIAGLLAIGKMYWLEIKKFFFQRMSSAQLRSKRDSTTHGERDKEC